MRRICYGTTQHKCGKLLGYKEPYEDISVTHGLCPECLKETLETIRLGQIAEGKERRLTKCGL